MVGDGGSGRSAMPQALLTPTPAMALAVRALDEMLLAALVPPTCSAQLNE